MTCLISYETDLDLDQARQSPCSSASLTAALHSPVPTMAPPRCNICSYNQPSPETARAVYHHHDSSRQVRLMMGVEGHWDNPYYLCPSCQAPHSARLTYGLNVCVSTSQLHNFHFPREEGVVVPPDSTHVDWITIPGATIDQLSYAWRLDYHREQRPQRVLLVAGLNDLIKGGNAAKVRESILGFKDDVLSNNRYHDVNKKNEFYVAPMLTPPKLGWFRDNGPRPRNYTNRLGELQELNAWIKDFNASNNISGVLPNFQTWGTRSWTDDWGQVRMTHRWNQWRSSEAVDDKLHLSDNLRAKMGKAVVKFFEGELERKGPLV